LEAAVRLVGQGQGASLSPESAIQAFKASLDDDLQPGPALEALEALADSIMEAAQQGARVAEAQSALQDLARVFGLHLGSPGPEERVVAGWSEHLKRFEDASTA
jgi:cysteinyl-tRNA synthetase